MKTFPKVSVTAQLLALLLIVIGLISSCNWTESASVSSSEEQGNGFSGSAALSEDGRYLVFLSQATNLVSDDFNEKQDVFVRDLMSQTTFRVSVDSEGNEANNRSHSPAISGDGPRVVFMSLANNLVEDDSNFMSDVFLRDWVQGSTIRISIAEDGADANGNSFSSAQSLSGNGEFVVYQSLASNLVTGDNNHDQDIFVYDIQHQTNTRVSVGLGGAETNGDSSSASISDDGRFVAFVSYADNIVENDTNESADIFVYDGSDGTIRRVSVDSEGNEANSSSSQAMISGDGRYVTFRSIATNLTQGDIKFNTTDIFLHDRVSGETRCITRNGQGELGNSPTSFLGDISNDGRYIAYASNSENLVDSDNNGFEDVFVYDRISDVLRRLSISATGSEANGESSTPAISGDGRYVAYNTYADNLFENDYNLQGDVVVRSSITPAIGTISPDTLPFGATTVVTISGLNFLPGSQFYIDGAVIANVNVVDESTITAEVTVNAGTSQGFHDATVGLPGTGPGQLSGSMVTCADCVTFIKVNCGCGCP